MTLQSEEGTYNFIKAVVDEDGIHLTYQCTGLIIRGSDFIDDDSANTWSDRDIQKTTASYLGVTGDDYKKIEVIFD